MIPVPGLFDIQINGAMGIGFNAPDLNACGIRTVADTCQNHRITRFLPTLITDSFAAVERNLKVLVAARETDAELASAIPGFHLEGPYIAAEDGPRGAHPRLHVRDPDWDEFRRWQDAANGLIRLVTLAPEKSGAIRFIEQLTRANVVVASGHTNASASQIRDAIDAGLKLSTHLGNGCAATLPRHDNPIWNQLAADELWASAIADGHHLPASVLKSIVRGKTPERMILTCDSSPLAGLPPGRYPLWGAEFDVMPDGRIVVPGTPYLAGSGMFLDECVTRAVEMAGITMVQAVAMASAHPAKLLEF